MDAVIAALRDPEVAGEIGEFGDMDRPASLVRRLAMNPRVIRAAGIFLRGGLRSLITDLQNRDIS
jgi:hypothetical protein